MAEQDRPNRAANKGDAEGERWSSDQYSVRNAGRDQHPEQQYPDEQPDKAGGITNRPLREEVSTQEDLPERGTHATETRDPGSRRQEGDVDRSEL